MKKEKLTTKNEISPEEISADEFIFDNGFFVRQQGGALVGDLS